MIQGCTHASGGLKAECNRAERDEGWDILQELRRQTGTQHAPIWLERHFFLSSALSSVHLLLFSWVCTPWDLEGVLAV